jgi:hypothetical protein
VSLALGVGSSSTFRDKDAAEGAQTSTNSNRHQFPARPVTARVVPHSEHVSHQPSRLRDIVKGQDFPSRRLE